MKNIIGKIYISLFNKRRGGGGGGGGVDVAYSLKFLLEKQKKTQSKMATCPISPSNNNIKKQEEA